MAALGAMSDRRMDQARREDSDGSRRRRLRIARVDDLSDEQFQHVLAQVELARSEVVSHTRQMRQNIIRRVQHDGLFHKIMTDPETGLYNRRFLEIVAPLAVRELRTCTLVRVMVEGLTTETHTRQIAEGLRRLAQPQDMLVRAGRDHFVVLTPDQAVSLESLREQLRREAGGTAVRVTSARKGDDGEEFQDLMDAAHR